MLAGLPKSLSYRFSINLTGIDTHIDQFGPVLTGGMGEDTKPAPRQRAHHESGNMNGDC
jgi:hypothetical protein